MLELFPPFDNVRIIADEGTQLLIDEILKKWSIVYTSNKDSNKLYELLSIPTDCIIYVIIIPENYRRANCTETRYMVYYSSEEDYAIALLTWN